MHDTWLQFSILVRKGGHLSDFPCLQKQHAIDALKFASEKGTLKVILDCLQDDDDGGEENEAKST